MIPKILEILTKFVISKGKNMIKYIPKKRSILVKMVSSIVFGKVCKDFTSCKV